MSHVEGTDRYARMRDRRRVRGLTARGHYDEPHAALYFVDLLHGLAYLHRCVARGLARRRVRAHASDAGTESATGT